MKHGCPQSSSLRGRVMARSWSIDCGEIIDKVDPIDHAGHSDRQP